MRGLGLSVGEPQEPHDPAQRNRDSRRIACLFRCMGSHGMGHTLLLRRPPCKRASRSESPARLRKQVALDQVDPRIHDHLALGCGLDASATPRPVIRRARIVEINDEGKAAAMILALAADSQHRSC